MIIRHFVGNNNLDTCKIKRSSGGQLQWSSSFDSCRCRPVWPDWAFFAILATLKSHFLPKSADLFIILEKGSNLSSENCLCNDCQLFLTTGALLFTQIFWSPWRRRKNMLTWNAFEMENERETPFPGFAWLWFQKIEEFFLCPQIQLNLNEMTNFIRSTFVYLKTIVDLNIQNNNQKAN